MEVVAEKAPGEKLPPTTLDDVIKEVQEQLAVGEIKEDSAARVPGNRDQVEVALGPEASDVGIVDRPYRGTLELCPARFVKRDGCAPLWTIRYEGDSKGVSLRETPQSWASAVSPPQAPPRAGR